MRRSLSLIALPALLLASPAHPEDVARSLRTIGQDICEKSLDRRFAPFDASDFAAWLAGSDVARPAFCGCVGERYATEGDAELLSDIREEITREDTYFTLNFTMFDHMSSCRAELEGEEATDGDLVDFDPQAGDDGIGVDHEDVRICLSVLDGDMPLPMPGFAADRATAHLRRTDQDRGEVCGCAAGYLAAQGSPLQDAIQAAANPPQAYGAALQLWTYVQMPAMAIGAACSSMAAQNVGAGRWDRVDGTAKAGVLCNVLMTGALIAPMVLLDRQVLGLFLPAGSAALEAARHLNHIAVGSFVFFGVTFVISGVVRSTGAVIPPLIILGVALWGVRVPVAKLLQPWLGMDAIWWSFPASSICAMVLSLAYYRWGRWREARMLQQPLADEETVATPAEVPGQPPAPVCALRQPVARQSPQVMPGKA